MKHQPPWFIAVALVLMASLQPVRAQTLPVYTFAGNGTAGTNGGFGSNARFEAPTGVAADGVGNIYVADMKNSLIRKITTDGFTTNFAGSAGIFGSTNGALASARFNYPRALALGPTGELYVADTANAVIRKITPAGIVSTLAGSATNFNSFDGAGTNANFYQPLGLAVDGAGNLFVADSWNHTIRKITAAGVSSTVAGMPRSPGCADGVTNKARFNRPAGLALDSATNLFVADSFNHIIRRITPAGVVSTIAGLAGVWGNADGTNTGARFFQPEGIAVLNDSNLLVADTGNHTLRKLSAQGINWVVTTLNGVQGNTGFTNGGGGVALFNFPVGLATDAAGNLYLADSGNHTIRTSRLVPPTVQWSTTSNLLITRWANSAEGFVLESSAELGAGANWQPLSNHVFTDGDNIVRTNNPNGQAFYRLRKP